MRVHKYKAWDNQALEWIDLDTVGLSFTKHPTDTKRWIVTIARENNIEVKTDITFLKYTGLYGDRGQEICEGDVVYAYKPNSSLEGHYVVVWDEKRGRWAYKNGNIIEKYQVGKVGNMHCVIQGNILEHTEFQYIAKI